MAANQPWQRTALSRRPVCGGFSNSSDESFWPSNPLYAANAHPCTTPEYAMAGCKGGKVEKLRVYDAAQRVLIDQETADMRRNRLTMLALTSALDVASLAYAGEETLNTAAGAVLRPELVAGGNRVDPLTAGRCI